MTVRRLVETGSNGQDTQIKPVVFMVHVQTASSGVSTTWMVAEDTTDAICWQWDIINLYSHAVLQSDDSY